MRKLARAFIKVAAIVGFMTLTLGLSANPDPSRSGAANDGGTSGPGSPSGDNGGSSSGSGR